MGRNGTRAAVFAQALRRELDSRGFTVRGFGKRVDPADPERGRRRVQRHLSGKHLPSGPSRRNYALALGIPADSFEPDVDTEERDLNSRLTSTIRELRALQAEVRASHPQGERAPERQTA